MSSKVAGETASLTNPALDRLLDFAGESGLVVLIHNDMDVPFPKEGAEPAYLSQMKAVLSRHPNTTIIWAHTGMGRIVRPVRGHAATIELRLAVWKNISKSTINTSRFGTRWTRSRA